MTFSKLAEIEWGFEDFDVNWTWCVAHANFVHKEACEFIIHVGDDNVIDGLNDYAKNTIAEMREENCTEEFIKAYEDAARAGAIRVLFWAE